MFQIGKTVLRPNTTLYQLYFLLKIRWYNLSQKISKNSAAAVQNRPPHKTTPTIAHYTLMHGITHKTKQTKKEQAILLILELFIGKPTPHWVGNSEDTIAHTWGCVPADCIVRNSIVRNRIFCISLLLIVVNLRIIY